MGILIILIFALGICYLIANTGDNPIAALCSYGFLILIPIIIFYTLSQLIYDIIS